MSDYPDFTIQPRAAQPFVGATAAVQMDHFAPAADQLPKIFGWLAEHGITPAGAPFFRYRVIDMAADMIVQVGVPVATPPDVPSPWEIETLPAGCYVTTTFTGHPDRLMAVTGDLLRWTAEQGLHLDQHPSESGDVWGCRLELHETEPTEVALDAWVTTLAFRLAD